MITTVDFSGLRFLPGCNAGLDEPTVLLDMRWSGQLAPPFREELHRHRQPL